MSTIGYQHIEIGPDGDPTITGTGTKVVFIAMDWLARRWTAEVIQRQRPHLTLGQIHSALAYYFDHEDEMNRAIEERRQLADELLRRTSNPALRAKLRAAKDSRAAQLAPGEGLAQSFGAWAEDAEELEKFLKGIYRDRGER